jgi:hypothetical protein
MPSVLNVDTLVAANGTDPVTLTKQSAAKGHLFSSGTTPSAQGVSLNISSIADTSTGNFQISLVSAMSDNNPTVIVSQYQNQALGNVLVYNISQTLSSTNIPVASYNGSSAASDFSNGVATVFYGDLA